MAQKQMNASTPSASSGFSMMIEAVFSLLHPELVEGVEGKLSTYFFERSLIVERREP
jgi:hypothetical protein